MMVPANTDYGLEDIALMKVATQEGDYANWYMGEHYPQAELIYVHDVGEGLQLVLDGKADAVIGDEPVMLHYASKLGVNDQIRTIETALYEEPVCLAFPKGMEGVLPVLNEAIKNISEKGQLEKIQQKWFGISTPLIARADDSGAAPVLGTAALVLACVILISHLNNQSLRQLVNARTRELEMRKDELQLIFDQMPEGVVLVDEEGMVRNGSSRFFSEKMPASRLDEGVPCRDIMAGFCGNPECGRFCGEGEASCIVLDTLRKNDTIIKKVVLENEIYELRSVPTSYFEEKTPHRAVLMVVRDITLDEANSQQLLQTSKMVAIGQLAGGMAHQIRNPLGIIRTQSFIIRNGHREDDSLHKSLNYIDESVKRASEIIDNVMNFWRVSDDAQMEFSVREQIESVVLLQEKEFSNAGVEVKIRCDESVRLYSSADALKHILHNLVSNAIDAMDGGGTLTLSALRDGGRVELRCEDTGCGISEKNLQNLFNPFFTTKEPGKGTGLGLFIVYSEVDKVGGTIDVYSREGEGTRFVIRIPDGQVKHE
jgi:polar amino acid transport system substrate-binding protein